MSDQKEKNNKNENPGLSRREFLKRSKNVAIGIAATGILTKFIWVNESIAAIPVSEGYLLVDTKKCQGCASCMLACSLVHEGVESLSLSRIQIIQNSFESFPEDLTIEQCRQCVDPPCVNVCPTSALIANARHGNVRMVHKEKCIGCGACFDACPYTPSRPVVAADKNYGGGIKSRKCDLCAKAPYHWDKVGGGPGWETSLCRSMPSGRYQIYK